MPRVSKKKNYNAFNFRLDGPAERLCVEKNRGETVYVEMPVSSVNLYRRVTVDDRAYIVGTVHKSVRDDLGYSQVSCWWVLERYEA